MINGAIAFPCSSTIKIIVLRNRTSRNWSWYWYCKLILQFHDFNGILIDIMNFDFIPVFRILGFKITILYNVLQYNFLQMISFNNQQWLIPMCIKIILILNLHNMCVINIFINFRNLAELNKFYWIGTCLIYVWERLTVKWTKLFFSILIKIILNESR